MSRGICIWRVGGACCALLAFAGVASFATTPSPVSPGEHGRFARIEARCPSFSWTFLPAASSVEIAVFAQPQGSGMSTFDPEAAELVLLQRLPGATSSWTPSLDRCLEPGRRYVWYVRALQGAAPASSGEAAGDPFAVAPGSASNGSAADSMRAPWSEPRLFEVRERAAEDELADAIEVVRRYLRERGELPDDISSVTSIDGEDRRRELRRDPDAADRPEVARRDESATPEREESAAGSEPTLVLGGDPVARLAASDFVRQSGDPEVFDFHNPGAGTMTLRVDGVEVVTTATDQDTTYLPGNQLQLTGTTFAVLEGTGSGLDADLLDGLDSSDFVTTASDPWVDEAGDTMTGALTINPASGHALVTASGDSINLGGNVFRGGTLFLHATGTNNTGAGLEALAAVTTGSNSTAVGAGALDANTSGYSNTALGADALGANLTGSANTAIGRNALLANTASGNTAVGVDALDANTSGIANTALGANSLGANLTSGYNTAIGYAALNLNTASSNTAVGAFALVANTTGASNTALGRNALNLNQTGGSNTAIGRSALLANTGSSNTAVGASALDANTTGTGNTALGANALGTNSTGTTNTAIGRDALFFNTVSGNTAVGAEALDDNTTGVGNTALGYNALSTNQTGDSLTALGRNALIANTASGNTAVGASALDSNTSGTNNTTLGRNTLDANTTGSNNIAIGAGAGEDLTIGSNNIAIGNAGVAGESGKIRIGSPQTETFIAGIHGNTSAGGISVVVNASGDLGTTTSSRRFKEDIRGLGEGTESILALRPVSFRYTRSAAGEGERPIEYGLIAEEVAEVLPDLVVYDDSGAPYTVRYHLLLPLLLAELQRQSRENAEQRAEIEELRRQVTGGGR